MRSFLITVDFPDAAPLAALLAALRAWYAGEAEREKRSKAVTRSLDRCSRRPPPGRRSAIRSPDAGKDYEAISAWLTLHESAETARA